MSYFMINLDEKYYIMLNYNVSIIIQNIITIALNELLRLPRNVGHRKSGRFRNSDAFLHFSSINSSKGSCENELLDLIFTAFKVPN